jgi:hypothetical protein
MRCAVECTWWALCLLAPPSHQTGRRNTFSSSGAFSQCNNRGVCRLLNFHSHLDSCFCFCFSPCSAAPLRLEPGRCLCVTLDFSGVHFSLLRTSIQVFFGLEIVIVNLLSGTSKMRVDMIHFHLPGRGFEGSWTQCNYSLSIENNQSNAICKGNLNFIFLRFVGTIS